MIKVRSKKRLKGAKNNNSVCGGVAVLFFSGVYKRHLDV